MSTCPAVSVVIPVRDQAPRLRLTLAALERQEGLGPCDYEVVVVDDGSQDEIADVLREAQRTLPCRLRTCHCSSGGRRGVPRNIGAAAASGELILFLDADACPSRCLLSTHLAAHGRDRREITLGDCFVIQQSEMLRDPSTGARFPRFAASSGGPPQSWTLSLEELRAAGDAVLEPWAEKGLYPGWREWHRQLEEMLSAGTARLAWAAVIPHNLSISRRAFVQLGGFDALLLHSEGWDLGIRAQQAGHAISWAPGARSFHLHHWRAPGRDLEHAERANRDFARRYPEAGVEAVALWIESVGGSEYVPAELNLDNWRIVVGLLSTAEGWDLVRSVFRHTRRVQAARSSLDYLASGAVNRPFRIDDARLSAPEADGRQPGDSARRRDREARTAGHST